MKHKVLSVDDNRLIGKIVTNALSPDIEVTVANSAEEALALTDGGATFDLFLFDVEMPEMTGHDLCRLMKRNPQTAEIPIIFLTGLVNAKEEKIGFELGAADYITKPFSDSRLMARVKNQLDLLQVRRQLKSANQRLEELIQQRTDELNRTRDLTIMSLATLSELRDDETGNHIRRTQNYVRTLAAQLLNGSPYEDQMSLEKIDILYKSAPLHDVGKVGIPDEILKKPGRLNDEEMAIMRRHPGIGKKAFEDAEKVIGGTSFLTTAKEIAFCHHEKWDGTGYPLGLKGEEIPLSARLMAVADVYDALISERCYKPAFSHQKSVSIILESSGTHFDPVVIEAFKRVERQFKAISTLFADKLAA